MTGQPLGPPATGTAQPARRHDHDLGGTQYCPADRGAQRGDNVSVRRHDPGLPDVDTATPHPARIYDCLLGGKDHFPADRAAAEQILAAVPQAGAMAKANRAFLQRAVRFLAEAGIGQFLDLGSGLPTHGNIHQTAQAITATARVVYVDNDPIVHVHGNALLADQHTTILFADLREPDRIVGHPKVRRLLDWDRPVAVLLVAVLHFVRDTEDPAGIVAQLCDAVAPGSYLVISHATADFDPQAATRAARAYDRATAPMVLRSHAEVAGLFDGLELVDPGLVQVAQWRPDPEHADARGEVWGYGGVGWKPLAVCPARWAATARAAAPLPATAMVAALATTVTGAITRGHPPDPDVARLHPRRSSCHDSAPRAR